ncbi:MAG: Gfo/Idh/MocA family oxidoreductase [Acidobacteriia bacterium]|nr:Gfo/Idh/MocA family oxidoreductase [Terriglobia bacterium]
MSDVRIGIIGVGRIRLPHAETVAHRTHGARLVAVSLAATQSIRDGRPVNVELGPPETTAKKSALSSSDEGRQRRDRKV